MNKIKKLLMSFLYGVFIDYHMKKAEERIDRKTLRMYHFELAQHYYKKVYGHEFDVNDLK